MDKSVIQRLARWREAGIVDAATAERIRAWEAAHASAQGSRLGRLAFGFGGLLLAAGILLFVAAHWDQLSPWARFALLACTVAGAHVAAGFAHARLPALATSLHAVGTVALGGGVFLAGQAFNLAEQWPDGILLWAIGAAFALAWLRDVPHVLFVALLVPAWLVAVWQHDVGLVSGAAYAVPATGLFVLGAAYLAAVGARSDAPWRHALARLGVLGLLGAGAALPLAAFEHHGVFGRSASIPAAWLALGWAVAALVPLAAGFWLRGRQAWPLVVALAFALLVTNLDVATDGGRILLHLLYLGAAVGVVLWGVHDGHRLRVNVGVAAFALVVLSFYYSSVFDRFGRALGLIALGALFLGGGWLLERTRRRLLERIDGAGT